MDYSLTAFSVHGILQSRILEWVTMPFSRDLPDPGIEPASPALAGGFFTTEPPGKSTVLYVQEMVNTRKVHRLHLPLLP